MEQKEDLFYGKAATARHVSIVATLLTLFSPFLPIYLRMHVIYISLLGCCQVMHFAW